MWGQRAYPTDRGMGAIFPGESLPYLSSRENLSMTRKPIWPRISHNSEQLSNDIL